MEELKQNKTYKEAKEDKLEGMSNIKTSCLICKFKPNYLDAIPNFRSAADSFFGLGKTYPKLYKENLILEEIFCREKLILCYENEKSWIDAADQGIKLAKYYVIYYKNYDMAFKTLENAIITYLQTTKSGNANVLKAIKALNEMGILFLEHNQDEWANKNYKYSYDTILSLFPGQAKSDQPYECLYDGLFEYFDYLFSKRNFETCINKLLEIIQLISPTEMELENREIIQGKENDVDKILTFYYKIICICICEENEEKLNEYIEKANSIISDSVQRTIINEFRDIFKSTQEGNEKDFNRQIGVLKIVLRNCEQKELRGIMKKNKAYVPENNDIKIEMKVEKNENNFNMKGKKNFNFEGISVENSVNGIEMKRLNSNENMPKEKAFNENDNLNNDIEKLDNSLNDSNSKEKEVNKERMEIYKIEDEEEDPNIVNMENKNDNDGADEYL